jgi:hypothetical protein
MSARPRGLRGAQPRPRGQGPQTRDRPLLLFRYYRPPAVTAVQVGFAGASPPPGRLIPVVGVGRPVIPEPVPPPSEAVPGTMDSWRGLGLATQLRRQVTDRFLGVNQFALNEVMHPTWVPVMLRDL